jgi:hypothetical protein
MKELLQSPVIAALILAAAMVYGVHTLAGLRVQLGAGEHVDASGGIVIEAPNGFQVDVHGEVKIPETMNVKAEVRSDAAGR